ncbi:aldolase [Dacryopinax primogenitus]|uniref:Aldolase n=1 Tax=Dacryopinax primogenitus (strain DJM 731) TaxID=1858805 RepID=M5FNP4_DACPD|nr:aldolase [Dacryopinax primogenitus]EJT97765.1 aldolase [Dacryopinax primogenitus]
MSPVAVNKTRTLKAGVHVPVLTFFESTAAQDIDIPVYENHVRRMAAAGVESIVVLGSTGEAVTLSLEEKKQLISVTRKVLDGIGFEEMPVIAGLATQSTREAMASADAFAQAGADYLLALPPSYYAGAMTKAAIKGFYTDLADASPIPVIIYSYPGVSSGLELDSEDVLEISTHRNIRGIKQTDHNVGKMARIAAGSPDPSSFAVLGGASEYLIGSLAVGAIGCITGMANLTPVTCVRAYKAWQAGDYKEAQRLQGLIATGEWAFGKNSLPGVKAGMNQYVGYGGVCRKPVPEASADIKAWTNKQLEPLFAQERAFTTKN